MNRRLAVPLIVAGALALGVGAATQWSAETLDRLVPDAPRVDDRVLVVDFAGSSAPDGGASLSWPAHRRAIYLRDIATAAARAGAAAVVYADFDGLALMDGAPGRQALAQSDPFARLAVLPLQEVAVEQVGGALPLATRYRVDDLSAGVAGVGIPAMHRSGTLRVLPLFARTLPLRVGDPPVAVPADGRDALDAEATNVMPLQAVVGGMMLDGAGPVTVAPDSFGFAGNQIPLERGGLRVRWTQALDGLDDDAVVSAAKLFSDGLPDERWHGKVVLVGTSDETQTELIDTPIGPLSELMVQANALNTLLTGSAEQWAPDWIAPITALVAAIAVAVVVTTRRRWLATAIAVAVAVGWLVAVRLAAMHGWLLDPLLVPVAALGAGGLGWATRGVDVAVERRRLRALFSQYVPAAVAKELVDSGSAQSAAAGVRLRVTVLFCDLRGFTPLAGRLAPAEVRELLDAYYDELTPLILDAGGTVMQYTGDEIFAVFGAPAAVSCDADVALGVALAMHRRRDRLNERLSLGGLPPVDFGIGVHSGDVVAAHVGPRARRQYSVVGDTVNVGSRLCSLARAGQVAYSDETRRSCATSPDGHSTGSVQLKGVSQPVEVFVVGDGDTVVAAVEPAGAVARDDDGDRTAALFGRPRPEP